MDYSSKTQRNRWALDQRSVIVAVVVLLVGAALGFGGGYKYAKHGSTTKKVAVANSTPSSQAKTSGSTSARSSAQARARLVTCLAAKGIKYPSANPDVSVPPPGVARTKWDKAVGECYLSGGSTG